MDVDCCFDDGIFYIVEAIVDGAFVVFTGVCGGSGGIGIVNGELLRADA